MAGKRKRKGGERPGIHPRNRYSDNPPDFGLLASLYPTFQPYVFYSSRDGKPRIDWTDFNATRELTRVLLFHDHALNWWVPDGQLCPTVPNRLNYIHWIEDLLASDLIPGTKSVGDVVKGFDIGTGANCIYPLLGASLLGWKFIGSDITDVAIEWATQNVMSNPHISELIEIRRVYNEINATAIQEVQDRQESNCEVGAVSSSETPLKNGAMTPQEPQSGSSLKKSYNGPSILVGVVKDDEKFDFCMCNPPFFESMEEAGSNPKTSCGGTPEEMVCRGGEHEFITRIIEDSVQLKDTFRWYSSMVGRKLNLNNLVSQLWKAGATIVKTTEFVQGKTSRWGLAWSFLPASRKVTSSHAMEKNNHSFMLEGIQRQYSAFHVLQSVESFFTERGASCKSNPAAFNIDITTPKDQLNALLNTETKTKSESVSAVDSDSQSESICFRISVFQQIPGTLLVKGTLQEREIPISGLFKLVFKQLEEFLKNTFCTERVSADRSFSSKR